MKRPSVLALLLAAPALHAAPAGRAAPATARAEPRPGRPGCVLFAVVEPVQTVTLRAAATGRLSAFRLRPGEHVRRGERIARLRGPSYAAALASAQAAATAARQARALGRDRLRATEARYPVLSDRLALDGAKLQAIEAQATLRRAQARLAALRAAGRVASPVAGTVSAVLRGDGERVAAGDALARIEPAGALWLRGAVYGKSASAVRVGMRGHFVPAGGGKGVPVRIATLIPGAAGAGLGLGLAPAGPRPNWFSGEGGLVTLAAAGAREPAVPTSALVLSRGRWWVVKKVHAGFAAVRVRPDGARGGWTWIAAGLRAGDTVVTTDAYLVFHRAFSKKYANED